MALGLASTLVACGGGENKDKKADDKSADKKTEDKAKPKMANKLPITSKNKQQTIL